MSEQLQLPMPPRVDFDTAFAAVERDVAEFIALAKASPPEAFTPPVRAHMRLVVDLLRQLGERFAPR